MNNNKNSSPTIMFLVGWGFLLIFVLNGLYDSLKLMSGYISWIGALVFGCIIMPMAFYYLKQEKSKV